MSDLLILFCDCHWNWNECLPATGCLVEDTTTGSALKTLLKKWNLYRDFFNSWSWSYEVTPCAQLEVLRKESAQSFQVLPVLIPVSIHTICWDVLTNHFSLQLYFAYLSVCFSWVSCLHLNSWKEWREWRWCELQKYKFKWRYDHRCGSVPWAS